MRAKEGPLLPDVGVIALTHNRWRDPSMSRHKLLRRLARYFHVVWVNPPTHWRELVRNPAAYSFRNLRPAPGLTVLNSDYWLPDFHRPRALSEWADRIRVRRARWVLRRQGVETVILHLWRPKFEYALSVVPHDLSCYHVVDEYTFSFENVPIPKQEARVLESVNQVFVHSPGLLERKGHFNPHTAVVPNGVDYQAFCTAVPEPADLAPVPRPRIGYSGWVKRQLDWPLLDSLSARHPEWSFVFVGAHRSHHGIESAVRRLSARSNVFFLGAKSSRTLATYPQHFDVCIMPYRLNAYTDCIYPLKLHEYLASGRPVVGSAIRSLREFEDVLALPDSPEQWSDALREALSAPANSADAREKRQAIAREYDWDRLARRVAHIMAGRLGEGFGQRFETAVADEAEDLEMVGVGGFDSVG